MNYKPYGIEDEERGKLMEKLKALLDNNKIVTGVIAIIVMLILGLTSNIPALENYTIVECSDISDIETCAILTTDIETTLFGVFKEVIGVVILSPDIVPDDDEVLVEVEVTVEVSPTPLVTPEVTPFVSVTP